MGTASAAPIARRGVRFGPSAKRQQVVRWLGKPEVTGSPLKLRY